MRKFLSRAGRALAYTAATLVALALLLLIYAFVINSFDEPLTPQAQALLAEPAHLIRPEDNLYIALLGFGAPAGESPLAAGQRRIERYNAALDRMLSDSNAAASFSTTDMPQSLQFSGDSDFWSPLARSLWETAKAHRSELQQARSNNAVLLERYQALHKLLSYEETAKPSYYLPFGIVPPAVHALYLASIADRLQSGQGAQYHAALQDLGTDLGLWRTVLTGEGSILSKMVAAAALRADFLLLADLIADPAVDPRPLESDLRAVLTPFATTDWQLREAFAAEYRATDAVLRPEVLVTMPIEGLSVRPIRWLKRQWNKLGVHFFKLHATENLRAAQMAQTIALSTVDLEDYSAQLVRYHDWASRDESVPGLAVLYNPMGRLLTSLARGAYGDYQTRVFDTAALLRLPLCAFEIRTLHLAADAIPAFLTQHPEWCSHVIPGHPFRWNPTTRELSVVPLGKHNPTHRWAVALHFL